MKKIVIAGYYGFRNVGDDAVLTSMIDDIREIYPDSSITVIGLDLDQLREQFNVEAVHLTDFQAVYQAVKAGDILLLGGGGIFNDYLEYPDDLLLRPEPDLPSFGIVYGFPLLALIHQKPAMTFAAGASYIKSDFAKRDIALGISVCSAVTLRDPTSREILRSLPGLADKPMAVTADPVFRLRNSTGPLASEVRDFFKDRSGPLVAVSLRHWDFHGDQTTTEAAVAGALNEFQAIQGGGVLFLPFDTRTEDHLSDDVSVFQRVAATLNPAVPHLILQDYLRPGEASALIGECDLAVTMRLHPTVMAIKNQVPFVALVYDQKVQNILDHHNLPDFSLDLAGLNQSTLAARLAEIWVDRQDLKKRLASAAPAAAQMAAENLKLFKELLEAPYVEPSEKNSFLVNEFLLKYIGRAWEHYWLKQASVSEADQAAVMAEIRNLANSGDYQSCLQLIWSILENKSWPDDPMIEAELFYLTAYCLQHLNQDPQEIERCYAKALELGFNPFWIFFNRGQSRLNRQEMGPAIEDLNVAYELNPDHPGLEDLLKDL